MAEAVPEKILSSKSTLTIADLLSTRPRSLGELAYRTGVSMPAVLKHLEKLEKLGVLEKTKVSGGELPVRRLYAIRGVRIGDYSVGGITIVSAFPTRRATVRSEDPVGELETLAADMLVEKRRIREQSRRLARTIGEVMNDQQRMNDLIEGLGLDDEERIILQTAFTEETLGEAEEALAKIHGMKEPRRSIERVLAKARRNVKR